MGLIHAEIELINGEEKILVRRHLMDQDEVRKIRVRALVDSGAYLMAINENIQEFLQLPLMGKERTVLASGEVVELDVVGPVEVCYDKYSTLCDAVVLPGDAEPLLGSIPMECMHLIIDPRSQELIHHSQPIKMVGLRPAQLTKFVQ